MIAVSTSPAFPISGSTRTAAFAYTSVTSLPTMYLAMSKSCIVISMNMPPDTALYSAGGGAGSREVIFSICGAPILPSTMSCLIFKKLGSKRRLNPIISLTPDDCAVLMAFLTTSSDKSTGFSQNICFPALATSSIYLA